MKKQEEGNQEVYVSDVGELIVVEDVKASPKNKVLILDKKTTKNIVDKLKPRSKFKYN